MFPRLEQEGDGIDGENNVKRIFADPVFAEFSNINVLPLIYDESKQLCNILVFDYAGAREATSRIVREEGGRGRRHPVYRFYDSSDNYVCEVRYGDATANTLQRGLWTHTKNASKYFDSVTDGRIDYSHNHVLVTLFSHALVSSGAGHESALEKIKEDIILLKQSSGLPH